jgi:hypothetical protein
MEHYDRTRARASAEIDTALGHLITATADAAGHPAADAVTAACRLCEAALLALDACDRCGALPAAHVASWEEDEDHAESITGRCGRCGAPLPTPPVGGYAGAPEADIAFGGEG